MRNSIQTLPNSAVINPNIKIIAPRKDIFTALDEQFRKDNSLTCKCVDCDKEYKFISGESISWIFCSLKCRENYYLNYK